MPIQAQFLGDQENPICIVISNLDSNENYDDLLGQAQAILDFGKLTEMKEQPGGFSAVTTVEDRKYRISFSTRESRGLTIAMAMLGEMKESAE